MKIYITGHISPDLDTVAAAVAYAEFLKKSKRYEGAEIIPVIPGNPNKETQYVFKRFSLEVPPKLDQVEIANDDAFILVDHNEESQRHEKVVSNQVIEIIDHHKININFTSPIRLDVKPLGSTSSLVYEHFEMYGIKPSEGVMGIMLASILSDTQGLKSSLTTGYDVTTSETLAQQLNLDLKKFTFELFRAKSDITGLSAKDIATKDYKIFEFGSKKVFINQVETVEPNKIIEMKPEIIQALESLKSELGVNHAYCAVTDILNVNSQIIYPSNHEKQVVETAFTTQGLNNVANIGPKMSRKKDIAPAIETATK